MPVRPLVPTEGRLLVVGRLLTVGLLTLPLALVRPVALLAEGRLELLPFTLLAAPAPVVLDMLPLLFGLRPSLCRLLLMEPAVLLPCLTLAT